MRDKKTCDCSKNKFGTIAIHGLKNSKKRIYATTVSDMVFRELKNKNKLHSSFRNGMNLQGRKTLIFIGDDSQGELPFGIHLSYVDLRHLLSSAIANEFYFSKINKEIVCGNYIIDMSRAKLFSPKLSYEHTIEKDAIDMLYSRLRKINFENGLGITMEQMSSGENPLIIELKRAILSDNTEDIKNLLFKIIGRGKGLTPSGDDILIGLIYLDHIKKFISETFLQVLKEIISNYSLTTDISKTYYFTAFSGLFSSMLLNLQKAMVNKNINRIDLLIRKIIGYGHTSGRDILSGIALGINIIYSMKGGICLENCNCSRRECLRK